MPTKPRTTTTVILSLGALCCILALIAPQFSAASGPSERKPIPTADELKKLPPDGGPEYNRLVFEKSPYLLQHAGNPVDWYPWGDEAFDKARKEDKPVLLSIGYSTCHWCHVMEHESFEDDEVAALLNEHFVCIKVDREERPDIDNIYMQVCQAMTGGGGWPLTVLLTPDKTPFFAGTYFPKTGRFGREGMTALVPRIGALWRNDRDKLLATGRRVLDHLRTGSRPQPGAELDANTLELGFQQLKRSFDSANGGFGGAPKFPTPHRLSFLLRYWKRTGDAGALRTVEHTLQAMRRGGIYDHVGFGFHRYSTDQSWLVPHFEKMLYDQAMLVIAYVEAYQATGKEEYAQTAREVLAYVLRDMTDGKGGFYSAEDADSEGVEGKFYVWSEAEIKRVLDADADLFIRAYNIQQGGNFRNPHTPPNSSIPHLTRSWSELAARSEIDEAELRRKLAASREKLFAARKKRIHPYKDDKILTDWNGLMIAAMAKGASALNTPEYATAAQRAADFVWEHVRDSRGRLLKRHRHGESALPAHVEDYSFMVWGLLELYEANFEVRNLKRAVELNEQLLTHFWDDKTGGLFFTADDGEPLPMRSKEVYDGAIPSGNSVAMSNLLRIASITGNAALEEKAAAIGRAFSSQVSRAPSSHAQLLCALDYGVGPSYEIVIAGERNGSGTDAMIAALRSVFAPNKVLLFRPSGDAPEVAELASFTANQTSRDGKATAYVCRNHQCKLPTTDPEEMLAGLAEQTTSQQEKGTIRR